MHAPRHSRLGAFSSHAAHRSPRHPPCAYPRMLHRAARRCAMPAVRGRQRQQLRLVGHAGALLAQHLLLLACIPNTCSVGSSHVYRAWHTMRRGHMHLAASMRMRMRMSQTSSVPCDTLTLLGRGRRCLGGLLLLGLACMHQTTQHHHFQWMDMAAHASPWLCHRCGLAACFQLATLMQAVHAAQQHPHMERLRMRTCIRSAYLLVARARR